MQKMSFQYFNFIFIIYTRIDKTFFVCYTPHHKEVVLLSIGQRLKDARKNRGISQDALAEKIGTSRGVITNIEHDKIDEPQTMVINAICNVLNINKDWLLSGKGTMNIDLVAAHSAKILSEIYSLSQELSEEEQLFILDIIKSYKNRLKG